MSSVTESLALSWDIRGRYKASLDSIMVLIKGNGEVQDRGSALKDELSWNTRAGMLALTEIRS